MENKEKLEKSLANIEKNCDELPANRIQEIIKCMMITSKLEEMPHIRDSVLKGIKSTAVKDIEETHADFSSKMNPLFRIIESIQKDFIKGVMGESLRNISKSLRSITVEELEALLEEVSTEEKKLTEKSSKKQSANTSKIKKIVHEAQQKAISKFQEPYAAILNGTATNQLTRINTKSVPPMIDIITGNATIEKGTLKIFIDKYSKLKGVRTSTLKLLDTCTMYLTSQNNYRGNDKDINPNITIPLEHYMKLCGIPLTKSSKDKTRRKIKEDLETLYHISLEWTEPIGKKTKDFAKMRICDKIAVIRGNIVFNFSKDMAKYLTNAYIMHYPMELLKVDERNSNSYPLGRKLLLHQSMNNNKKKKTSDIISVKSLLEVCPDIPMYESVMNEGRQLDQRIRTPLEKALNSLDFITWEYCNSKGIPLTEKQLTSTDYKVFEKFYVKFDVLGFPTQTPEHEDYT